MLRLFIAAFLVSCSVAAEDWPQFLGPRRDGSYAGEISSAWPKEGPIRTWQKNVGDGFAGPAVAEGKEHRVFEGKTYILELGIRADLALVKAWKGDTSGNLVYRKTARNFNPVAATCGRITVAEVENLVEAGELDPDDVHTPGIYVQRIVHHPGAQKRIEQRTTRKA